MKKILLNILISLLIFVVVGILLNIIMVDIDNAGAISLMIAIGYLIIRTIIAYINKIKNALSDNTTINKEDKINGKEKKLAIKIVAFEIIVSTLFYIALWVFLIFIAICGFTDSFNNVLLTLSFISIASSVLFGLITGTIFTAKMERKTNKHDKYN